MGDEFAYAIIDRTRSLVGTMHIFSVDWTEKTAEIGYGIHHHHEGKGLVAASIAIVEETLKGMGFQSLQTTCPEWNTRSWAVAQRCGYELEKVDHDGRDCSGCDECTRHYKKRL